MSPHSRIFYLQVVIIFRFGFGILDAETIVNMAQVWVNVGEKTECTVLGLKHENDRMRGNNQSEQSILIT